MRKKEQLLWDAMKAHKPIDRDVWLERIENLLGEGMPDVNVMTLDKFSAAVELKAVLRPKRASTPLLGLEGLRVSQISWHRKAASMNLPVYTLVRDDKSELFLVHCKWSVRLNEMTLTEVRAARCADSWPSIYEVITK